MGQKEQAVSARLRISHLTELKAEVHEAKLAKFQGGHSNMHACAERSFVRTGYNTAKRFLFGFSFPFSLLLPRRGGNDSI